MTASSSAAARPAYAGFGRLRPRVEDRLADVAIVRNAEHAALHRGRGGDIPKTLNPYARGDHYPYTAPNAHEAKILHFNGELKPWVMSARDVAGWSGLGLRITSVNDVPHVRGTCQLTHCASSYNLSTEERIPSACAASLASSLSKSRARWDQLRRSPAGRRWSLKSLGSVAQYYEAGCVARPPLCTCVSSLSDDCVTSCASLWHAYVSPEVIAFHDAPVAVAPVARRRYQRAEGAAACRLRCLGGEPAVRFASSLDGAPPRWPGAADRCAFELKTKRARGAGPGLFQLLIRRSAEV